MELSGIQIGRENAMGLGLALAIGGFLLGFCLVVDQGPQARAQRQHREVRKTILVNPDTGCRYELSRGEVGPFNARDGRQLCAHTPVRGAYF